MTKFSCFKITIKIEGFKVTAAAVAAAAAASVVTAAAITANYFQTS
jgi:hypothetical protein